MRRSNLILASNKFFAPYRLVIYMVIVLMATVLIAMALGYLIGSQAANNVRAAGEPKSNVAGNFRLGAQLNIHSDLKLPTQKTVLSAGETLQWKNNSNTNVSITIIPDQQDGEPSELYIYAGATGGQAFYELGKFTYTIRTDDGTSVSDTHQITVNSD